MFVIQKSNILARYQKNEGVNIKKYKKIILSLILKGYLCLKFKINTKFYKYVKN